MAQPLSREVLLQRGQCCGKGCMNCPYIPKYQKGSSNVKKKLPTDR